MRIKSIEQQYFDFSFESTLKVVNEYREKYNLISQLLDENPQLVSLVHQDLAKMLSKSDKGRLSQYTSEQILRCLVVKFQGCRSSHRKQRISAQFCASWRQTHDGLQFSEQSIRHYQRKDVGGNQ
jgi:hypothetical protein